ncbi:hypothetical protein H5410_019981 [Solanum commersonii]|uniref:Disease resistance N-terminal domain-containing protein n=1 Tax=Solanum commersonii TaxID=4109 RepID=A0A9J5ZB57_SOLCO|nr:hypothetical protein H5410_019981 [Solanum commersonii]
MHHIVNSYSINNISSLKNLSTLTLSCKDHDESFPSLEFVNCCEKLQKLWLKGRIEKLPNLFPNSITMMVLEMSKLTKDPMPIFGMLPNLRNLILCGVYKGKEIMCSDNSFSQLEFLSLNHLRNLQRWHLGTSAMPLIKGLGIHHCPNLKEIPERMKDLKRPCLYNFIDFLKFFCTNNVLIFGKLPCLQVLRDEVKWLKNELLFMQSFLKDAKQKQCGDQRVQQWFEINSIANDVVAILKTYNFEVGKRDDIGFASCLKKYILQCRQDAKEIQSLKQRIMDISRRRETYGITNIDNNAGEGPSNQPSMVRTLRRTNSYVDGFLLDFRML